MNKDDKKNNPKKVTVKYKGPKDTEKRTFELEVKPEEQTVDNEKFKDVKSNPFRTSYEIYVGGSDDKSGNDWKPQFRLEWASWASIVVGGLALLAGLYFLLFRKKKQNKREEEAL